MARTLVNQNKSLVCIVCVQNSQQSEVRNHTEVGTGGLS